MCLPHCHITLRVLNNKWRPWETNRLTDFLMYLTSLYSVASDTSLFLAPVPEVDQEWENMVGKMNWEEIRHRRRLRVQCSCCKTWVPPPFYMGMELTSRKYCLPSNIAWLLTNALIAFRITSPTWSLISCWKRNILLCWVLMFFMWSSLELLSLSHFH